MPIFRGIEVSVVASTEAKNLPEYPHQDGSSVHLKSPEAAPSGDSTNAQLPDTSILSDGDPTSQKKVHPRISVYVPSMAGEQFWLRYNIIRAPAPATHLYFKMYMNGAHTTSWGIPVEKEKVDQSQRAMNGTVVRALYEPGKRWSHTSMDTEGRPIGIETRYFHFMPGSDQRSIAEDGGLIEVQVFRSKGRKRRIPKMLEFRNQERYGIASPSGGLVENPQDATYYDWLLIDPKDSPYASFRFHYRSMKYLLQSNIVPESDSRPQLPRIDSGFSIEQWSTASDSKTPDSKSPSTPKFTFGVESLDTTIFGNADNFNLDGTLEDAATERFSLKCPPELVPTLTTQENGQLSNPFRESLLLDILGRPIPTPRKPRSRHASQSSVRSACPSLTPSLVNYVDTGNFGDDEVRIGMAHTGLCSIPSMVELPNRKSESGEGDSLSDYQHSPSSSAASLSQDLPSPERWMSDVGSIIEHHIAQFTSPPSLELSPSRTQAHLPPSPSENTSFRESTLSPGNMNLSESEWMKRTPPPAQRKKLGRLWIPRLGRKPAKLTPEEIRRRARYSDMGSYSSTESFSNLEDQKYTQAATMSAKDTSDDAITPRSACFPQYCNTDFDLNSKDDRSGEQNSCGSYIKPTGHELDLIDKPLGNWI